MALRLSVLLLGASSVLASSALIHRQESVYVTQTVAVSVPTFTAWNAGAVNDYPIHSSCNATERTQLTRALGETMKLAQHAKEHILRWGNSSEIYQKYFGNATTGEPVGWYEKAVNGDKASIIFRCDDPDGNCHQEGWGGHWRGSNATSETVICPLSYSNRKSLDGLCGFGWTVATGAQNLYWASDLLHRLFHIPQVGEGAVEHYAGEYDEVIELAHTRSEHSVRNSDTLQYFALEAYAYDIAVPGEGCTGKWTATSSVVIASSTLEVVVNSTGVPTTTVLEAPSVTSQAAKGCHTHADGIEHCT